MARGERRTVKPWARSSGIFVRRADGDVVPFSRRKFDDFFRGKLGMNGDEEFVRTVLVAGPTEERQSGTSCPRCR
jgi:hypothetical protein